MKKHVPFLLSLLIMMAVLVWSISAHAQCLQDRVALDLPINGTATDQSAYQHIVVNTGATFGVGQDGTTDGALSFGNANQYATIAPHAAFTAMSSAFTMSAWVYPTALDSYNTFLSKLSGSHRDFVLRVHSDGKFQFHYTNSSFSVVAVTTDNAVAPLNTWTHLAATFDGSDVRLFVNGVMVKQQALTEAPVIYPSGTVNIGTLVPGGGEHFTGRLDGIVMRSFATPEDEVACLQSLSLNSDENLVMALPLNGDATDASSLENHGTVVGATAAPDRWNEASGSMNFDGTDQINIPHVSSYATLASAFTISAWIKPNAITGVQTILAKTGVGERNIVLRVDGGKLTAHYYISGYSWCIPPVATIAAGEWSHIACVWDGLEMILYHNGQELHRVGFSGPQFTATANWSIGALTTTGGEVFTGQIDDLNIWGRAFSVCELRSGIHANEDLLPSAPLFLCEGQTITLTAPSGYCSYRWLNDGSTDESFLIDADNFSVGDHQIVLEAYDHFDHLYTDTVELSVSLCTGINETSTNIEMKLFPNPASHTVTVSADNLSKIQLLDIAGRLLFTTSVNNPLQTDLDVSQWPAGMYFVNATRKDGTVVSKRLLKH